mgnify:CR=1 FL=1
MTQRNSYLNYLGFIYSSLSTNVEIRLRKNANLINIPHLTINQKSLGLLAQNILFPTGETTL